MRSYFNNNYTFFHPFGLKLNLRISTPLYLCYMALYYYITLRGGKSPITLSHEVINNQWQRNMSPSSMKSRAFYLGVLERTEYCGWPLLMLRLALKHTVYFPTQLFPFVQVLVSWWMLCSVSLFKKLIASVYTYYFSMMFFTSSF